MRLLTWNVNARTTRRGEQAAFVVSREPDVVALQEVRDTTLEGWRADLERAGLIHCLTSAEGEPRSGAARGLLLASRVPLRPIERNEDVLVSATVNAGDREIDVLATQVPHGADGRWEKVEALELLLDRLRDGTERLRILCGDLNLPRAEHADGTVITFGQNPSGSLIAKRGTRWDSAERGVLTGLGDHGMADVFRTLHGYDVVEKSWLWRNRGAEGGFRLDHIIASTALSPTGVRYLHGPRDEGLSDHSAMEADFGSVT